MNKQEDYNILILSFDYKNDVTFNNIREKHSDMPTLILVEKEEDINKIQKKENENIIALPFYPSKINDALRELLINKKTIQKKIENKTPKIEFTSKVLIAEDNLANQELIKYLLLDLGIDFTIKDNGIEALKEYQNNNYDLILTDINMPIMDGLELLKEVRIFQKENNLKHIPIVAITANAIKGDQERYLSLGMDGYLSKPINLNALKSVFDKFLEKGTTPLIDINKVIENLGVNHKIAELIIQKFEANINEDIEELKTYINNNDQENICKKAHYIRNSCLNVALDNICQLLEQLEDKSLDIETKKSIFIEIDTLINKS